MEIKEFQKDFLKSLLKSYELRKDLRLDYLGWCLCPSENGLRNFCEHNSCDTCWCLALDNKLEELEEEGND